jgi:hypothetical protein
MSGQLPLSIREQVAAIVAKAGPEALAYRPRIGEIAPSGEQAGIEWGEWAPVIGQGADWLLTREALRSGAVEGNPLMARVVKSPLAWAVLKVASAAAMNRAIDLRNDQAGKLRRAGHLIEAEEMDKTTAKIAWSLTWLGLGPALNNAVVIARQRGAL